MVNCFIAIQRGGARLIADTKLGSLVMRAELRMRRNTRPDCVGLDMRSGMF